MKPQGVIILGSYGTRNIGDNVILTILMKLVRMYMPGEAITVIGPDPGRIIMEHRIQALSSRRTHDLMSKIRLFRSARLLIIGGGGLLQDNRKSTWTTGMISNFVSQALLARFCGCRIAVVGVSLGPLSMPSSRRLVSVLCKASDTVITRDRESLDLALSLGSNPTTTTWVPDLAFDLDWTSTLSKRKMANRHGDNSQGYCVLNLRPLYARFKTNRPFEIPRVCIQSLIPFLRWAMETVGLEIFFVPFDLKYDLPIGQYLEEILGYPKRFRLLAGDFSIPDIMDLMASAKATIGMRLHSLIFSYLVGTPVIPLVYDVKVANFARQINIEETLIPEKMDVRTIKNFLTRAMGHQARDDHQYQIELARRKIHRAFQQLALRLGA